MSVLDSANTPARHWPDADTPVHRRHHRGRNQLSTPILNWSTGTPLPADPPYWDDMFGSSVRVGVLAARRTFYPAIAVWSLIAALSTCYYMIPASHGLFDFMVSAQKAMGVWFPSLGMGLSVGILVELVKVAFSKPRRWTRANTVNVIFNFTVFGLMGLTHHYRYAFQNETFGSGNSFREVASKVVFDQFIWTVFVANPYQAVCYLWKNQGFSMRAVIRQIRPFRTFWGTQMLPVLVTNWAFWIPMGFITYHFPAKLQLPVSILAVTSWVMLLSVLTSLNRRQ